MPLSRTTLLSCVVVGVIALVPLTLHAGPRKADKAVDKGETAVAISLDEGPAKLPRPVILEKCETCHGVDGHSLHFDFPSLAGQRKDYLLKQLRDIKAGKRKVDVMVPVVSLLTDAQMDELATYFAAQPLMKGAPAGPAAQKVGKKIFDLGVPYRMVAQCSACHGTWAEGRTDPGLVQDGFGGFPALNGQHAAYTVKQLQNFRSGARSNDFRGMMHNLAKNMNDQEIAMVAEYIAGMDLPPAAPTNTVAAVAAPTQVAACTGCHGPAGASLAGMFPKLAGQQRGYLVKELTDIKSGKRSVPMMAGQLDAFTPEDFEVMATYFAAQTPGTTPTTVEPEVFQKGMDIFFEGTDKVLACYSCHNFDGRGSEDFGLSPGGYPMLFGQHSDYLVKALSDFRSKARTNDYGAAMHNIAKNMTDAEIQAVSAFLQDMRL